MKLLKRMVLPPRGFLIIDRANGVMIAPKAGVKVFVGSKALLHVIGTEMDYVEDDLQAGFVFNNPQAKSTCGCGESFTL